MQVSIVGAMTALAAVLLGAAAVWVLLRKKNRKNASPQKDATPQGSSSVVSV